MSSGQARGSGRAQTDQTGVTRTNLDLMRSVAVTLVLVDHTLTATGHQFIHGFDFGWLGVFGVYLFFVHTCLVLMWSLERRPHTLDFYVRRIFRIYPLAMIVILVAVTFHLQDIGGPIRPKTVLVNLLLANDLFGSPRILIVLWSLILEMEMYLVLPLLFLFARRERTLWPFLLFWAFGCKFALAAFGPIMPVYPLISNLPFFLPGVMAFIGYKRHAPRWSAVLFPLLLLVLCVWFESNPGVPRGWVAALAVGLLLPFFHEIRNRVVVGVTHNVAKYSYGVYLLHPLILTILFRHMATGPVWVRLVIEGLSVALGSVLAYHLIEHPLMRMGSRVANRLQQRFGTNYPAEYGLDLA